MANRENYPPVLNCRARSGRARVIFLLGLTIASLAAVASPADAHNDWNGGYRKFPWKSGTMQSLGTLPGQCPHCPGSESSSAWKAIDVPGMNYDTVYSISSGAVDVYEPRGGDAGRFLRIRNADNSYITYEHLDDALVTTGSVIAGQPIAVSGNSGNSTGAHLHFQRQSGTSFSSTALDLVPISSHGGSGDALTHGSYLSDNAGIGYSSMGVAASGFTPAWKAGGGYNGIGVTANIGDGWSPCREDSIFGTEWRYGCVPRTGVAGSVQTYFYGPTNRARAIMQSNGAANAYTLYRGILGVYTDQYAGHDWVYWLGYPTGNRYATGSGDWLRQQFESGYIDFSPSQCREQIYLSGISRATGGFCD